MNRRLGLLAVTTLAAGLVLTACSTKAVPPAGQTPAPMPTSVTPAPVSAIPGTHDNSYQVGPFKVTLTAVGKLPFTSLGDTLYGATMIVQNTSKNFTGWVLPSVEFIKGYSITGQVLESDDAGTQTSAGTGSDKLSSGYLETLYAVYQGSYTGHVDVALTQVEYSKTAPGTPGWTTVQLKI